MTPVHILKFKRGGAVLFDGNPIGTVARTHRDVRLYEARRLDGSLVLDNAYGKTVAMGRLARDAGLLPPGSKYRIEGVPSATGGPWTVV